MSSKPKPCLPFGWVVKQSSSYPDRVYYFNTQTGDSTWEMPDLIKPYLIPEKVQHQSSVLNEAGFSPESDGGNVDDDRLDLNTCQQPSAGAGKLKLGVLQPRTSVYTPQPRTSLYTPSSLPVESPQSKVAGSSAASVKSAGSSIENISGSKPKLMGKLQSTLNRGFVSKPSAVTSDTVAGESLVTNNKSTGKTTHSRSVLSPTDLGNAKKEQNATSSVVKPVFNPPDILAGTPVPQQVSTNSSQCTPRKRERNASYSSTEDIRNVSLSPSSKKHAESPCKAKRLKLNKLDKSDSKVSNKSAVKINCVGDNPIPTENLTLTINFDSDVRKVVTSSESLVNSISSFNKNKNEEDISVTIPCSLDPTNQEVTEVEKQKSIQNWIDQLEPEDNLSECSDTVAPPLPSSYSVGPPANDLVSLGEVSDNRKVIVSNRSRLKPTDNMFLCQDKFNMPSSSTSSNYDKWKEEERIYQPAKKNKARNNFWRGVHSNPPTTNITSQREIVDMEVDDLPTADEERQIEDMDVCDIALKEVRQHLAKCPNEVIGKLTESVQETTWSETSRPQQGLQIIIDTNVLMQDLGFVVDLRDEEFEDLGHPLLIIPWVVMQELDALKNSKKHNLSLTTAKKARAPVDFLYNCFQNRHPRVIGQSPKQANEAVTEFKAENNDDRILQCCLQCQKLNAECHTVLLTNDKNLCSKANILGVTVFSRQDIVNGLKNLSTSSKSRKVILQDQPWKKKTMPSAIGGETSADFDKVADDILCKSRTMLKTALGVVLEKEMKVAYDDIWIEIVYRKPPWTLEDILDSFKKHWIAVFGHILDRRIQKNVERLVEKFKPFKGFKPTIHNVLELLTDAVVLLDGCEKHSSYGIEFKEAYQNMKSIFQYAEDLKNGKILNQSLENFLSHNNTKKRKSTDINTQSTDAPVPSSPLSHSISPQLTPHVSPRLSPTSNDLPSSNPEVAENRFQQVWLAISRICDTLQQWVNSKGQEKKTEMVLHKLVPTMKEIHFHFNFVLNFDPTELSRENVHNLTQVLNSFFSRLDLEDPAEKTTADQVFSLLRLQEKRCILKVGLQQLDNMCKQVVGFIHALPD